MMVNSKSYDFEGWLKTIEQNQLHLPPVHRNWMLKMDGVESEMAYERLSTKKLMAGERADIARRAFENLNFCSQYGCAPPPPLVALVALLLGADKPKRSQIRDREKFARAVEFKAANPDASATAIKKAVGADTRQINRWLSDPHFDAYVKAATMRPDFVIAK